MIAEEVLAMITTFVYDLGRQADLAMPTHGCADASWLRALPEFTGEVSVQGIATADCAVKAGVRVPTADVRTFPGTTAWSPPT